MPNNLLYGGLSYPDNSFSFDHIYSSKTEMDSMVEEDNVLLGRCVLVAYCDMALTQDEKNLIEIAVTGGYAFNDKIKEWLEPIKEEDEEKVTQNYKDYFDNFEKDSCISSDRVVFRKIYKDNKYQYQEIATLSATFSMNGLAIHNVWAQDNIIAVDDKKNIYSTLDLTYDKDSGIQLSGKDNNQFGTTLSTKTIVGDRINSEDKVLRYQNGILKTNLALGAEPNKIILTTDSEKFNELLLTLTYDDDQWIRLKSNNTILGQFDASDFVKDSFLRNVEYSGDNELIFTFTTYDITTETYVDKTTKVTLDIMDAGAGIQVQGNEISIKLDPEEKNLLYINNDGLGLQRVEADQVYFNKDLKVTTDIGYIAIGSNGNATIEAKDKSLTDVFKNIFVRATNPTVVQPSFSITWSDGSMADKYYEVGTTQTVSYLMKFDEGSYSYNNTTGVTTESFQWRDKENNNLTDSGLVSQMIGSGTSAFTFSQDLDIEDDMEYWLRGTGQHTSGAIPINNIGEDYSEGQIQETGVPKVAYSPTIYSYRPYYYGAVTKSIEDLVSADIKKLTKGGNYTSSKTITIKASGAENLTAFIVAIPSSNTRLGVTKVESTAGMTVDVTGQYTKDSEAVAVEANNIFANYDLWVWQPAKIDSGTIHKITLG